MSNVDLLRDKFLDFFKKNDHLVVKPAKLVREKDTIFTIAGMQQFWWYFLGVEKPPHRNLVSAQPCLRLAGKHNDLGEIGKTTRHLTNFTMLGNFSFGGLSKARAIYLAWEFLKSLGIDSTYIYVTIHHTDPETRQIWREYLPDKKIITVFTDDNFWAAGETGPCGPCTEIFIDSKKRNPNKMTPGLIKQCIDRGVDLLEIWNLVFMQFNRQGGKLEPLEKLCIDSGMGLERLASVIQGHFDVFKTDHLDYFVQRFKDLGVDQQSAKLLADHSGAILLIKKEGVKPGAVGAGGILRLLVRRCLDLYEEFNQVLQLDFIENEAKLRQENLQKNQKLLAKEEKITEEKLVYLYQTHGLAREKLFEQVKEHKLNLKLVEKLLEDHKKKSKKLKLAFSTPTDILCYEKLENSSKIIGLFDDLGVTKQEISGSFLLVAEASCFYGQGGGQDGDIGTITTEDNLEIKVNNCTRQMVDEEKYLLIHHCTAKKSVKVGQKIRLVVDRLSREAKTRSHSATHLLSEQIMRDYDRKIMGSSVKEDRFTLDYSGERFSENEIGIMLTKIHEAIEKKIPQELLIKKCSEEKYALGTEGKHPEAMVRVVNFGKVSSQLCGGTHVKNTDEILSLEIISDKSMGKGIRRLSCLTGKQAEKHKQKPKGNNDNRSSPNILLDELRGDIYFIICEDPKINTVKKLLRKKPGTAIGIAVQGNRIRGFIQNSNEKLVTMLEKLGCSGKINKNNYTFGNRSLDYKLILEFLAP
jgi:alanyl-tRNA synthetase